MSEIGKELRLKRIFRDDGRTLIVPMEAGPLDSWVQCARDVIAGGADAIMTTYGLLRKYHNEIAGKIPLVFSSSPTDGIEYVHQAVKLGGDALKISWWLPLRDMPVKYISELAFECKEWGIPFIFEPMPMSAPGYYAPGYSSFSGLSEGEKTPVQIYEPVIIRKVVELGTIVGADAVKATYTGATETFKKVVKDIPIPVIIAGGPQLPTDRQTLEEIKGAMNAGAAGGAIGRNLTQNKNRLGMTKAIVKIIHEDASVDEALKELE